MHRSFGLFLVLLSPGLWSSGEASAADESPPSFQRHVAPLLGKLGCNGGACHGAVQGRAGFRLSLFGADSTADHGALVRDAAGRRVDLLHPEASLLLAKATGRLPHGGGVRLQADGPEHRLLVRWIAAGAPADEKEPSRLKRLLVAPSESTVKPGESRRLQVTAEFVDGGVEDVTAFCSFESQHRSVATVNDAGEVRAVGVGDAGLLVRYRADLAAARVVVPRAGRPSAAPPAPHNDVDRHVLAALERLGLPPADLADDATFLRRVHLDVVGAPPTADEVREFLADERLDKRTTKIDELLSRPGHVDVWTLKFCDLLKAADFGVYADAFSKEHDTPRMQAWIRARLAENLPYDQFVERILLATSREGRTMAEYAEEVEALFEGYAPGRPDLQRYAARRTLDLYWQRRGSDGVKGAMQVAHAFLGLRLECAQCHRHPHDLWQQEDLLDFGNFFMRVRTVGFQGENEKRFPDAAEHFRRFNDEAKRLEAEVKQRKEGDGKRLEEEARQAKAAIEKLKPEIRRLEQSGSDADALARQRQALAEAEQTLARAESYRRETVELERRAKLLPEAARRLLQGEARLLDEGPPAKATSTLGTRESRIARLLGESEPVELHASSDPRAVVVEWMRRPENPYFARAVVNRIWAHYFGRGIVDPPDNLSAFNPPSHPELLQSLCDALIAGGYDLRSVHRAILNSRTYQQSSIPAAEAAGDRTHYAAFPVRRLPAELLLDALDAATETRENLDMQYHHWPASTSAVRMPFVPQNRFVAFVLETYGRPLRNAAVQCDCERDASGSIFQVLTLANHPRVWEKIRDPAGRASRLEKSDAASGAKIDELFLATVGRFPTEAERTACERFVAEAERPEEGLPNVLWSLLNTREFLLQH